MTLNNMHGKALGIARVLYQLVKMFYIHAAEPRAVDTPAFELQVDPPVGNAARSSKRWLFFLPPEYDTSVSVTEYTLQLGGRHEPGQREQRTNRLGVFHAISLFEKTDHFSSPDNELDILVFTMSYTSLAESAQTIQRSPILQNKLREKVYENFDWNIFDVCIFSGG